MKTFLEAQNNDPQPQSFKLLLENGAAYWSMPEEELIDFLHRALNAVKEDYKVQQVSLQFNKDEFRSQPMHRIKYDFAIVTDGHVVEGPRKGDRIYIIK